MKKVLEVEARYVGGNENKGYMVNVRPAHRKGNFGDGGVIRTFETKQEAKTYSKLVNETGQDIFVNNKTNNHMDERPIRHYGDDFINSKAKATENTVEISSIRAILNRLTDEQIKEINETGRLPEGVKISKDAFGQYHIRDNTVNFYPGTRTVPEGYELKKDWLGFTVIVPKDTEGMFIRDVG